MLLNKAEDAAKPHSHLRANERRLGLWHRGGDRTSDRLHVHTIVSTRTPIVDQQSRYRAILERLLSQAQCRLVLRIIKYVM